MLDKIHNLPTIIDIILIPDFSLMAFSSAIEPLRLANRLADRKLYDWRVVSVDGNSVVSSNGVEIVPSGGLNIIQKPKLIFVISGYGVQFYNNEKLFSFKFILFKAEVLNTLYPVSMSVKFKFINKLHIKVNILFAK